MPATPATPPPALRPYLTARHELLWNEVDAFAAEHVAPRAVRMEAAPGRVERKVADLMAARKWFAVTVPSAFGGLAAGHVAKTVLIHRIARVSAAAAAVLQATLIPVGALLHFATVEQQARWLPGVADGSLLLSIAVTEPTAAWAHRRHRDHRRTHRQSVGDHRHQGPHRQQPHRGSPPRPRPDRRGRMCVPPRR